MRKLFGDFFEDKTILLTGHTGFIGSWLAILLIELGAKVIGYALAPYTEKDNFVVSNIEKRIISIIGDIRNYDKLLKTLKKYQPEIVYHFAAQPIVRKSYKFPKETYDVNVGGTINIFESFRKTKNARILINFTTDKCYENKELERGYKEDDRLGGYDPYSSSKACSELITSAYRNSFFNINIPHNFKKVASVRCGNIIGGGDWQNNRIIPDFMRSIINKKSLIIRNPESVRPWQYVLEPLRGFLILTLKLYKDNEKFSNAWNFGPNIKDIYTVREIIEKIIQYLGEGSFIIRQTDKDDTFHETKLLLLDNTKARKFLGWEPEININDTIKFVCEWYREKNIDFDFNIKQINDYFRLIKKEVI